MSDDKMNEPKKNFSNSFILIIMGIILALIVVQNFMETKVARVSFSYQLEPLVNLDLIQPDESRKTASGANLVTFSGRFRDRLTDDGKNRYRYLDLLDQSHELAREKQQELQELDVLKKRVKDSATLFLQLYGKPIPQSGFTVLDEIWDTPERENRIVITNVPKPSYQSFVEIDNKVLDLKNSAQLSEHAVACNDLFSSFQVLIRNLRSPFLGIGNETMKQELRAVDATLSNTTDESVTPEKKFATVLQEIPAVGNVFEKLNTVQDHVRLQELRSVRAYKENLEQYVKLVQKIEDVTAKLDKARQNVASVIWFFNNQELSTRILEKQEPEVLHQWFVNAQEEWKTFDVNKGALFKAPDQPSNKVLEKTFKSEELPPNYLNYLMSVAPIFLVLFLLYFAFSRQMKGMGGGAMDFNKSPAKLYPKGMNKITFKDVAGIEDCIEELEEIVEFLKSPKKFTSLGGKIPKGVLLIGSPGTGKTLVAKAVAGEADCPFFSISGSDFVEMFVGVGASRIRKMFEEAKKNAPCIIFIDEIDAVGRHRGAGFGGGHDEREQTLNQLLVEMDGFDTQEGIIIVAATNRPDILDKALLRPGRFDRQVFIPLPDIRGRFEILKVHARNIKLDTTVDLMQVARSTPGCSGAELRNLLNEAALLAARNNRKAVTSQEIYQARDKVLYGKERRNLEIDEQEKRTTAFHESGHAVVGALVKHADPIDKVTIIPRGVSLGATQFLPKKNRVSYWRGELVDHLAVLMGGRVAESVFVHDLSSGAKQDLERATQIARNMVCSWGMSDYMGPVSYDDTEDSESYQQGFGGRQKKYSEQTAQEIDKEVRRILDEANDRATSIINSNKDIIEQMTAMLIEFESLDAEDVKRIVAREWNEQEKRDKEKIAQELQKKDTIQTITPPPPPPEDVPAGDFPQQNRAFT